MCSTMKALISGHQVSLKGITTLCYIFNEDFNLFYDWGKKIVNENKIVYHLEFMHRSNYSNKLVKLISQMLDLNEYQRIGLDELYNNLSAY